MTEQGSPWFSSFSEVHLLFLVFVLLWEFQMSLSKSPLEIFIGTALNI
jgi:hypothetical protein